MERKVQLNDLVLPTLKKNSPSLYKYTTPTGTALSSPDTSSSRYENPPTYSSLLASSVKVNSSGYSTHQHYASDLHKKDQIDSPVQLYPPFTFVAMTAMVTVRAIAATHTAIALADFSSGMAKRLLSPLPSPSWTPTLPASASCCLAVAAISFAVSMFPPIPT